MPNCPRCDLQMKRITANHKIACSIPPPSYLARLWLDSPTLTTKKIAHLYNVHTDFMRDRLILGGIPAQIQANRGYIIRRMNWGMTEREKQQIPYGMKTCPVCAILIPIQQTSCNYCSSQPNCISPTRKEHEPRINPISC